MVDRIINLPGNKLFLIEMALRARQSGLDFNIFFPSNSTSPDLP